MMPVIFACENGQHKGPVKEKVTDVLKSTGRTATNSSNKENSWQERVAGDSTIKRQYLSGRMYFESLKVAEKKIYNRFFPRIRDAFLFEDKFYLKADFPLSFAGKVNFNLPECPDYVLSHIGENAYQIVINDALDLNRVLFEITYHPAEKDSLILSEFTYTHVVYEE